MYAILHHTKFYYDSFYLLKLLFEACSRLSLFIIIPKGPLFCGTTCSFVLLRLVLVLLLPLHVCYWAIVKVFNYNNIRSLASTRCHLTINNKVHVLNTFKSTTSDPINSANAFVDYLIFFCPFFRPS